jgi:tetratricopeptide (TPR) repeat protein
MNIDTVKKLLANQERTELYSIISKLSNYSEDAEEWLFDYCSKKGKKSDSSLIVEKQIQHYWSVAEDIIDDANMYGGTYNEDDVYDALDKIDELAKKNKISWECRRDIVDSMLEQFYIGNSGFDDTLIDTCEILCQSKEEKLYLADKISESSSDYYRKYAAGIYLKYGKDETFIELQSKNLEYGSDYIRLADYYKKNKQMDKAISLVEEALKKCNGRLDEVYEWLFKAYKRKKQERKILDLYKTAIKKSRDVSTMTKLMYEYYSENYEKKKPYLLKMIEVCDGKRAKEWYDECKRILTSADFEKESEQLHEWLKKKNVHDYLQLRIYEGNTEEVLKYLKEHPSRRDYYFSIDYNHNLTKQLVSKYPKDIVSIYWKECEGLCVTSNKKDYMEATAILKEIKAICQKEGMQQEWSTAFASFLERHRRKRLLMGYVRAEKKLQS